MKKAAIIFYEGYVSVSPTVYNTIECLIENNYFVDIYTKEWKSKIPPVENKKQLNFIYTPKKLNPVLVVITKIARKLKLQKTVLFLSQFNHFYSFKNSIKKLYHKDHDLLIGVDSIGLISAGVVYNNQKFVYLSLEILEKEQSNLYNFIIKKLEKRFHKKASFTLIQDSDRLNLLAKINNIPPKKHNYRILPNSPRGVIVDITKNDFFQKRFNIDANTCILLNAGMINDCVCSCEIAEHIVGSSDFITVFHERYSRDIKTDTYLQKVQSLGGQNLYLSLQPVPYEDIYKVYTSADIGLVVYNVNCGDNYTYMSGASGKMTHYLKYGLPIIVLKLPGFEEIIDTYKCGVIIESLDLIGEAVKTINSNYDYFQENALKCYSELFDFDNAFTKVVKEFDL